MRDTIDELTRAEQRISVLESAARQIARMVSHNAERIMQVRLLDFILIIGISLALGSLFNLQNPKGLSFFPLPRPEAVKTVTVPEAVRLLSREKALLIDARPREFFELGHAPGAINVPPSLFDALYTANFNAEDPERPLIIYGRTVSRLYDEMTARKFINRDHEQVYLFLGDPAGLSAKGEAP
ncbi:MAG: hypothetical protein A2464_09455 [Deltaproteobacteria bacterium RIFOXYC2_FULL_48_10]|nr:MAG: hypothetical protein A2464_09455 [Deltaproteobacteria bacterium RIFOXYC2_FULL_48_10]